jgi:hypothetical protein
VQRDEDGTWRIKAGSRVRVRVTMVARNRRYHVALVDPLPAGLEAMNPALAVTGPIPQDPNASSSTGGRGRYWWWHSTWYEHQNMRDERVEAFARELPAGVWSYSYVARATTLGPPVLFSNYARARVRVELGVFDPRAVIIGTVFVDANRDTIQNPGEPGVPGVRLVLEDGTYAITDGEGQYSIYGQRAVTHALKLDESTLPPSAKLGGEGPRFAGHPGLRFVDLKKHELHKANFTLVDPTESLYAAIEQFFDSKTGTFFYSNMGEEKTYESESIITPRMYRAY